MAVIGQTVSHYRILDKLGEGGMGVVYKAEDTTLRRMVALKFLPAHKAGNEEAEKRLLAEARAAAVLSHPNICTIYEIDEERSFIAMEFLDGQTLTDKIAARPLPLAEALDTAIAAAQGLRAAHARGVVHRDIKTSNLMLTSDGQVKIMDFGLAQVDDRARITQTGVAVGTPASMSPEQVRGERLDHRTDIWSLAVAIYEMVTGRMPFRGETGPAVTYAILNEEPEPPTALRSDVPIGLDRLLAKALEKNRGNRYQKVDDLLVDLRALRGAVASGVPALRRAHKRPSHLLVAAMAAVAAIAGGSVAAWRLTRSSGEPEIRTLAVLPLKSLDHGEQEAALEVGMADTIITRLSQLGRIKVRPTSAIRKYALTDSDTLRAAQELKVDAVLEGTLQRDGDRLRVGVNLLRVADGSSMWAESFNVRFAGIFDVQDQVSSHVAAKLQGRLTPALQAALTKRITSNPEAYAAYTKGLYYSLGSGYDLKPHRMAIELLQKAVEIDPDFALAHAKLALAAAQVAIYFQDDPALIARAKQELVLAERLDPNLAEVHVARGQILGSQYEGFRIEDAIRELRLAQKLDSTAGLAVLAYFYAHLGLDDKWVPLQERAIDLDPGSELYKGTMVGYYYMLDMPDQALAAEKRFFNRGPGIEYYVNKRMVKELRPLVEASYRQHPEMVSSTGANPALLLALEGRHREAQAMVPEIMAKVPHNILYHHIARDMARVYALGGKAVEAVQWLRATADTGLPAYTLFLRDTMLDPIRGSPEFVQFMSEQKARHDALVREFQ